MCLVGSEMCIRDRRTLCDLIRYQQLKELGIVHSAKEFIQLFHSNEQEDTP